jgi:hypothetical protein
MMRTQSMSPPGGKEKGVFERSCERSEFRGMFFLRECEEWVKPGIGNQCRSDRHRLGRAIEGFGHAGSVTVRGKGKGSRVADINAFEGRVPVRDCQMERKRRKDAECDRQQHNDGSYPHALNNRSKNILVNVKF